MPSVYFLAIRTLPSLTLRMKINNIHVRQTECAVFWASILRNMERKLIITLENEIGIMSSISEHRFFLMVYTSQNTGRLASN